MTLGSGLKAMVGTKQIFYEENLTTMTKVINSRNIPIFHI